MAANARTKAFFEKMDAQGLKVTYGDVRLHTHHSDVLPNDTDLTTRFTRRTTLNVPIVSSPMDTVTTADMAIAMAEAGGLGVIHRGLSPEAQADEVRRVKKRLNERIDTPYTVRDTDSVDAVLRMQTEKNFKFSSFPVIDEHGRMVGLVTGNDLDFCVETSQSIRTIMTPFDELLRGEPGMNHAEAYRMMLAHKKKVLPLVDANQGLAGLYVFTDLRRIYSNRHRSIATVDANGQLRVGAAVGVGKGALQRAELLAAKRCDVFQIDTAHGDSSNVLSTIRALKSAYPDIDVAAGNVSSGDSALRLAEAGADAVMVGQGPGSICTTRVIAGVGVPQVSAVYECAEALEGTDVPLCADGGINNSGDMVIALAVGASTVMLGRLLAGTDEAPGETRFFQGMKVKDYRGMGSLGAMRDNASSRERYGQAALQPGKLVPEGIEGIVPYKGVLADVLGQYVGGIRSGLGYHGIRSLAHLREQAAPFRISNAGLQESHPHDVLITAESPNYSRR